MIRLLRLGVLVGLLVTVLTLTGAALAAPGDVDNDTIADASDNCPSVYNIDQFDDDGDTIGNTCDSTPGVPLGGSQTIIYHRDVTTGGPLTADPTSPRCVSASLVGYDGTTQSGVNTTNCYRRFTFGIVYSTSQRVVFTVLADPPDCRRLYTSPITMTFHGGTVTAINAYYLCGGALLLTDLVTASTGVGSGKSLADKAALAQGQYAGGNVAGACVTLTGYINEVKAQSGKKKITAATANDLIAKAEAVRTSIGC